MSMLANACQYCAGWAFAWPCKIVLCQDANAKLAYCGQGAGRVKDHENAKQSLH
jgi:hypothetical protein